MELETILKIVADRGFTASLITGVVSRCYLYPDGTNPEQGSGWIGYGNSTEGLIDAITIALEMESASLTVDFEVSPHGAVRKGKTVIAYLPEGARIGLREATALLATAVRVGHPLKIHETTTALSD